MNGSIRCAVRVTLSENSSGYQHSFRLVVERTGGPGETYCELLAYPKATEAFVNEFCARTGIAIDFHLQDSVWTEAGRRFAKYANRRRKAKDGDPKRLLADFLVGAHALLQADRLMTRDERRYRQDFPELVLL